MYKPQPWHYSLNDVQSLVITLFVFGSSSSRLDTMCYYYCLIMLCCVSHVIEGLKSYCTYVQEVSNVGTLTYLAVWIAFVSLPQTYPESSC